MMLFQRPVVSYAEPLSGVARMCAYLQAKIACHTIKSKFFRQKSQNTGNFITGARFRFPIRLLAGMRVFSDDLLMVAQAQTYAC